MDHHSPPSLTRSPVSSPNTDYPSPDMGDNVYKLDFIYDHICSMNPEPSLPSLDVMTSSAAEWNESNMLHNSSSGEVPPTIPSMDYDAFAGYDSTFSPAYTHDAFPSHPSHAQHHQNHHHPRSLSHTPDPVSGSNYPYPHSVSPALPLKMESHSGYRSPPEASQYPSPHSQHALPVTMSGYSSASSSSNYMAEPPSHSWPRPEYPPLGTEPYRSPSSSYLDPAGRPSSLSQRAVVHRAPRTKQRRLTTRDEANFQCDVKGCGKLFSRSYNFKAHLETHDEKREYPFPCQVEGCTKKFVRKTDLSRHHQSVHMKERNHKCDFCGRTFARKDTLRRHMEDGCSKRFDISTLNVRNEGYDLHGARSSSRLGHIPSTQLPPLTAPQMRSPNLSVLEPASSLLRRHM
ncbi:Epithelial zinc-finger ezf protein-like protein [Apiospora hydei]|uniref:Epithelial zinc-finger ezf protein-like protein n=1 Tax=Apiospora hydei TaxID=1337664 RepID=A0ABR1XAB9_9PEZI